MTALPPLHTLGPVLPVIVIDDLVHAVPLARALVAGGCKALEVTLRTPVALQAMERIATEVPDAWIGAGTLRAPQDAERALRAGARFALSPGYSPELAQACRDLALPFIPGVATASEAMAAWLDGHTLLKFFPAVAAGGVPMLKSLGGPFPELQFCPTGGLTAQNASEFLALPNVPLCGGTWLSPKPLLERGDWAGIEQLAREASQLGQG